MRSAVLSAFCGLLAACASQRNAELLKAVTFEYGNWDAADVARLLDEGADVNALDENGRSPLLNAYGVGFGLF